MFMERPGLLSIRVQMVVARGALYRTSAVTSPCWRLTQVTPRWSIFLSLTLPRSTSYIRIARAGIRSRCNLSKEGCSKDEIHLRKPFHVATSDHLFDVGFACSFRGLFFTSCLRGWRDAQSRVCRRYNEGN